MDKVLCNLPYGKKTVFSGAGALGTLLQELNRVLRPGRHAVLLCDHRDAMREALNDGGVSFELVREIPIHLGGLKPSIYVLKRNK